jgi:phosphohistidine phosphatase
MVIYLVQHGRALDKSVDPERGLSPEGIKELNAIAQPARSAGISVSSILHSGKRRAEQTAEIYAGMLAVESVQPIDGIQPNDDVKTFFNSSQLADRTMLVGHLPFLQKLAAYLVNGDADKKVVQFQNGGIVCLELGDAGHWYIKWTLLASIT